MSKIGVTSQIYIGVVGCKNDKVSVPFFTDMIHKEYIGIIIVSLDISSILLMIFFFYKIRELNLEYLDTMDDLRVQMKDFGVKIDNVKLDRYTQDSRLIKMKIWLHFYEILKPHAT